MFESIDLSKRPNWKLRISSAAFALAVAAGTIWVLRMTQMPLRSYTGPLPPLSSEQIELRDRLIADVKYLTANIGERNIQHVGSLQASVDYLRSSLQQTGYEVVEHPYPVGGTVAANVEAFLVGADPTTVVVGAHYDSVPGTVGADDNATGVAAVLELARLLRGTSLRRTVRFLFFVNEEPPYFQTESMGSRFYAQQLRSKGVPVLAMISLETIGFYSDTPGSQKYPPLLGMIYPKQGNFIGFVGNSDSRDLVRRACREFRKSTNFPSKGLAAPADWPGVGWSDQWSFWRESYPAIMITDTAVFRNPNYHTNSDTPDKLDFEKTARVVDGVRRLVEALANEPAGTS